VADRTLLALETSTLTLSLAVIRLGEHGPATVLARRDVPPGPNHSKLLPLLIEEALREAGVELRALDGIAVGLGPGAFTGLRIALSTGKGLAWATKLPLCGGSSLEAMALAAARLAPDAAAVVPLLDARKQEVYAGFYRPTADGGVEPLGDGPAEVVAPPETVAARLRALQGPIVLLGEGYFAYRALFDEATEGLRHAPVQGLPETPPAPELGENAARNLAPYSKEAVFALEPHYLRPSEVELARTPPKRRV